MRFDRAAGFYDATRGYPPGVEVEVAAALVRAGDLDRRSRVLEIGIGTGRIARPLAPHVDRIHGVDLSRPMLEQLLARREDARIHVALADAGRLPLASASCDAAVASRAAARASFSPELESRSSARVTSVRWKCTATSRVTSGNSWRKVSLICVSASADWPG